VNYHHHHHHHHHLPNKELHILYSSPTIISDKIKEDEIWEGDVGLMEET
jgi:hypothetical protein